jgi:hypothetical protein
MSMSVSLELRAQQKHENTLFHCENSAKSELDLFDFM